MFSFQVLGVILAASSSTFNSVYTSPNTYISLVTTASSINFRYSRILMIMIGCCQGVVLLYTCVKYVEINVKLIDTLNFFPLLPYLDIL